MEKGDREDNAVGKIKADAGKEILSVHLLILSGNPVKLRLIISCGTDPSLHHHQPVRYLQGVGHVGGGDQHRGALAQAFTDQAENLPASEHVASGQGLDAN